MVLSTQSLFVLLEHDIGGTDRYYYSQMCQHFLPLISQNGRIVNLSSIASKLGPYSDTIQSRFRDPKLSLADVDKLAEEFLVCKRFTLPVVPRNETLLIFALIVLSKKLDRAICRLRWSRSLIQREQDMHQRFHRNLSTGEPRPEDQRLLSGLGGDRHGGTDWTPTEETRGRSEGAFQCRFWRYWRGDWKVLGERLRAESGGRQGAGLLIKSTLRIDCRE